MSHEVKWEVPDKVIYAQLAGDVSIDDVRETNQQIRDYIEEATSTVHCMLDVSDIGKWPMDIQLFKNDVPFNDAKVGYLVFVGANATVNFVGGIVSKLMGKQMQRAKTIDEAMTFLQETDDTITVS